MKIVRIDALCSLSTGPNTPVAALIGEDGTQVTVTEDWFNRFRPGPGGYVVYSDGYRSFSPAKAFEEGYTKI